MSRVRDYHDRRTLTRVTAYRLSAAAAGLALLGTVGMLPSASASSARPVAFRLDHHLCYTIVGSRGFHIPTGVVLKDQFNRRGFRVRVGGAVLHCNPVEKILPAGGQFKITNPAAHLVCYRIAAPKQATPIVNVKNQFGEANLKVGQPAALCLPTWKRIGGPPHTRLVQPPGLSHFTCYPVDLLPGAGSYQVPAGIMLKDQFSRQPVPVQVGSVPVLLCLPTVKIVHGHASRLYNPALHLLCFPVSRTPRKPLVFDKNQFGTAAVRIGHTALLCLPSTKQIVHP